MATSVNISHPIYRHDSTILPTITGSGVSGVGFIKIHDWLYLPYSAPFKFQPPNRTLKTVPIVLRDNFHGLGNWTFDANVSATGTNSIHRTGGEPSFNGASLNTVLSATKCSIQSKPASLVFWGGMSLQNSSLPVTHDYLSVNVAHGIIFGYQGLGHIREKGIIPEKNGFFKYELGDMGLIELDNGIVRYYLVKPDGKMIRLRQTRSKLVSAPRAEVILFYNGSRLDDITVNSNNEVSASFENVGVMHKKLFWQKWNNPRTTAPIGDALEMADKRLQFTYPNAKTELRSIALTPRAKTPKERRAIEDFFRWHKNDREFIFVDMARRDAQGQPEEWWARFSSAMTDSTINACLSEQSVSIVEDFRSQYVVREDDLVAPTVLLQSVSEVGPNVIISGTSSDDVLIEAVELYRNGFQVGESKVPNADGTWSFSIPLSSLSASLHTFYAIAYDFAGNSAKSNNGTLNLAGSDSVAPAVAITSVNETTGVVQGTASDNVALSSLQFYLNGNAYGSTFLPSSGNNWTFPITTGDLLDGANTIYVRATDTNGNATNSSSAVLNWSVTPTVAEPLQFGADELYFGAELLRF